MTDKEMFCLRISRLLKAQCRYILDSNLSDEKKIKQVSFIEELLTYVDCYDDIDKVKTGNIIKEVRSIDERRNNMVDELNKRYESEYPSGKRMIKSIKK